MAGTPIIRSPNELGPGRIPVIFDVLGPDEETSVLPRDVRLVMHVNPTSMSVQYTKHVERIQTRGGYVEQHWGDSPSEISFTGVTGGLVRLYGGLSSTTNPAYGGTRRETLAYDKYLDYLALFHNNGSIYDSAGNIVLQGILKMTYDGGTYLGRFENFTVSESAEKPFMLDLSASFKVKKELWTMRSTAVQEAFASPSEAESLGEVPLDLFGRGQ